MARFAVGAIRSGSASQMEKYYPKDTWRAVRVKRGSIAIIHGNSFHKGPAWPRYGDPNNKARTAIRLDFHGHRLSCNMQWKGNKIKQDDYVRLSKLQTKALYRGGCGGREVKQRAWALYISFSLVSP
jgi:hypothetical protein